MKKFRYWLKYIIFDWKPLPLVISIIALAVSIIKPILA